MRKQSLSRWLSVLIITGYSFISPAQIPNTGFEEWDSLRCNNADPVVPVSWQTPCTYPLAFFSGLEQTTDAGSGSYAAKLKSSAFGDFIFYNGPTVLQTGFAHSVYPASLHGYYKYSTDSAGDYAAVIVNVFEYNQSLSRYDTLFRDTLQMGPASAYTSFTLSIPAIASGLWQDSVNISFLSDFNFHTSSPLFYYYSGVLYLDSLWLDDNANSIQEHGLQSVFTIAPNPATDLVTLTFLKQSTEVSIFDLRGKLLKQWPRDTATPHLSLDISELPRGIFFVTVISGNERMNRKLIKL